MWPGRSSPEARARLRRPRTSNETPSRSNLASSRSEAEPPTLTPPTSRPGNDGRRPVQSGQRVGCHRLGPADARSDASRLTALPCVTPEVAALDVGPAKRWSDRRNGCQGGTEKSSNWCGHRFDTSRWRTYKVRTRRRGVEQLGSSLGS
ncbi:hypothetical protein FRACA_1470002 [Frankia canadensis]|uniref:Uncharacterized protein n=1 Tax=Frankia canadensis TaxID=1836972 RepID=A0A2I2KLN9_9ACTN|nr:hypothetical protein FRACA_1470002 [Frankia canadensis]SOU53875.1 hypothetical protein FRACA_1470002 [Frankia canadensis]